MILTHHPGRDTLRRAGTLTSVQQSASDVSPRDKFLTVYGRKPVLAALADPSLDVDKVVLADNARGHTVDEIRASAASAGVPVQRASPHRVKVLAGNGKQDQGTLADVIAPRMRPLQTALHSTEPPQRVVLLDGITTSANVGMILRTATAAGIDGIVVPRRGVATLDPLVVKSSAGVAFHAPVLRSADPGEAAQLLRAAGYPLFGLAGSTANSLFETDLPERGGFVLGAETDGISAAVHRHVTDWVSIPMRGPVESLNVAAAASILCYELLRR